MLAAIERATLGDDVFLDDKDTTDLEAFIAELTGFPAALLVVSGTMGNQLSIRTHLGGPPHSIVADARSHIIGWWVLFSSLSPENESSGQPSCPFPHSPPTLPFKLTSPPGHREAGFLASLSGALAIPITPSNAHHLTLSDIKSHTITSTDIHACPTTLISLENTLNGSILPLSSCRAIAAWAHSQSAPIAMHLDGARLWEAVSAGAGSLMEYCACFDSVSLCFSKGLGAPIGSMIVGSQAFIGRARHIRKGLGGGMRQAGVVSAPARVAVEETFLGGKLDGARVRAREIARRWEERGGRLQHPVETNMVWLDLEAAGVDVGMFVERGVERGLKVIGGRLVVHYREYLRSASSNTNFQKPPFHLIITQPPP